MSGITVTFNALRLHRPRRHDRQIRMGPRRQRHLRDEHRRHRDHDELLSRHPAPARSACGSPTTTAARRRRRGPDGPQPRPDGILHGDARTRCRPAPPSASTPRLERPRRHGRQIRMGPRRQRELRDEHGHDRDDDQNLCHRRQPDDRPAGHRQQRRPRRRRRSSVDGPEPRPDRLLHGHAEPGHRRARP